MTSETFLNSILTVLTRKDKNIYILYERSLKYYGNIASFPNKDLRVLPFYAWIMDRGSKGERKVYGNIYGNSVNIKNNQIF